MPKMVAYELFEVTGTNPDAVREKLESESTRKKSVVVVAPDLRSLAHPLHLAEANDKFGSIGAGGKA